MISLASGMFRDFPGCPKRCGTYGRGLWQFLGLGVVGGRVSLDGVVPGLLCVRRKFTFGSHVVHLFLF